MPREALAARRRRASDILARLEEAYPDAQMVLRYGTRFQLLVAVMLSAQCTDVMVNRVTASLFKTYRTPRDFADADPAALEAAIRPTGYYRTKARNIIACARAVLERHGGRVPDRLEDLVELPGVGRKTANVVLWEAFGKTDGIAVDTHVARLSALLGLSRRGDRAKVEQDLMRLVARDQWGQLTHLFIHHGRAVCVARRPRCSLCTLNGVCPSAFATPPARLL